MHIRNTRQALRTMNRIFAHARAGHLRKPLLLVLALFSIYVFIYLVWYTPLPVYILDKLNLRPFFLPNILCNHCNNFTYNYMVRNENFCKISSSSDSTRTGNKRFTSEPRLTVGEIDAADEVFLLILVATYHPNMNARQAIRKTWGNVTDYRGHRIRTVFMFGRHDDKNYQYQVRYELEHYGDVIQADFDDSYKSLTNKSIMGLTWARQHCSNARYVLKTDDDAFNVPQRYVDYLLTLDKRAKFIGGYCFTVMPDRRDGSKFFTPLSMYPEQYYPTYCSGPGYVLSREAVTEVVAVSPDVMFITMEDVFVSGLCRVAARISYTQIPGVAEDQRMMTSCNLATWVKNGHNIYPLAVPGLWQKVLTADRVRDCLSKHAAMYLSLSVFIGLWCTLLYHMFCARPIRAANFQSL